MRKTISFVLAVAMLLACTYAIYFFFFEATGFWWWMPVAAGVGGWVAVYWLWEDFIKPYTDGQQKGAATSSQRVMRGFRRLGIVLAVPFLAASLVAGGLYVRAAIRDAQWESLGTFDASYYAARNELLFWSGGLFAISAALFVMSLALGWVIAGFVRE